MVTAAAAAVGALLLRSPSEKGDGGKNTKETQIKM